MTESDDDIWDFKFLKRFKRSESRPNKSQNSPRNASASRKPRSCRTAYQKPTGNARPSGPGKIFGTHARAQNRKSTRNIKFDLESPTTVKSEEDISNSRSPGPRVDLHVQKHETNMTRGEHDEKPAMRPLSQSQLKLESVSSLSPVSSARRKESSKAKSQRVLQSASKSISALDRKRYKTKRHAESHCKHGKGPKSSAKKINNNITNIKSNNGNIVKTKEVKNVREGYCPACQMPFSALILDSPERHVTKCLSKQQTSEDECIYGLACDVTLESHFRKFTHHLLAEARTRLPTEEANYMYTRDHHSMNEIQQPEPPPMESTNPSCTAQSLITSHRDKTLKRLDAAYTVTTPDENHATEEISDTAGKDSTCSLIVSTGEGGLNQTGPRIPNVENMEQLKTHGKESFDRMVGYVSDDVSYNQDSTEDIFDTQLYNNKNNTQLEDTEDDDMESSQQSEISTSILADPGPICQDPQQLPQLTETLKTQKLVQLQSHDSLPLTHDNQEQELTLISCQNIAQNALPRSHRRAKNISLDFDHSSQVDISITVTTCSKHQDMKQQSGNACNKQSFFQMKARKARHIQVIFEENQDSESAISDFEELPAERTSTPPISETDMKQSYKEDWQETFMEHSEDGKKRNSDYFMQEEISGNLVSSNSLKQSTLSSYFGWGSIKKEEISQESFPPKLSASHRTFGQNKALSSEYCNIKQRSSYRENSSGNQFQGKSSSSGHCVKDTQYDHSVQSQGLDVGKSQRPCPFYKKIQGTSFVVDAFRYGDIPGCIAYFLSHFHYDHYSGLTRKFDHLIYCSKITANLVRTRIRVADRFLRPLPMNEACVVSGVEVTLLEANHCPGAVLFLFRLNDGRVFLHTGDFRADSSMEKLPQLHNCHVNQLFLDTTYLDPQYDFPTQEEVMKFSAQVAVDAVRCNNKMLLVCGTYTIGKEKIFMAIAEVLSCKVFVAKDKKNILDCLDDSRLLSMLTLDKNATRLHVVTMASLSHQNLKHYLSKFSGYYDAVTAFKPTGWTHSGKKTNLKDIKPSKNGPVSIYGVPYSEHSSFSELRQFVKFLRPNRIIPTVNIGSAKSREAMNKYFKAWLS